MKIPTKVELTLQTANILSRTVLSSLPYEGCAILIGREIINSVLSNDFIFRIDFIWPCSNIWEEGILNDVSKSEESKKKESLNSSKKYRFAIDPREQLLAQKWARSKKYKILGIAHSHTNSEAIPSQTDLLLNYEHHLMVIIDNFSKIRAWWKINNHDVKEVQVTFTENKTN